MKAHTRYQSLETRDTPVRLAKGLGWFSIALGLVQLLAPRAMSRMIGAPQLRTILPLVGVRELIHGIGILSTSRPAGWVWSRVLGDIMDLGLLRRASESRRMDLRFMRRPFVREITDRERLEKTMASVIGITVVDIYTAVQNSRMAARGRTLHFTKSITIDRSPEDLYQAWRNFENLQHFMPHLLSVRNTGPNHSHWIAKGPAGRNVEWDAEITEDRPNQQIAWGSLPGSDVINYGVVTFERAPAGRGTVVRVDMDYIPPGGMLGHKIAKLFHKAPEQIVPIDLHRFKMLMETGEIVTTEGQPAGRPTSTSLIYDEYVRS